jgi:hypothetical protein
LVKKRFGRVIKSHEITNEDSLKWLPGFETDVGFTLSFLAYAKTDNKNDMQPILLATLYIWCLWFVYQPKKNSIFVRILLIAAAFVALC